jgi:hypothetical protein
MAVLVEANSVIVRIDAVHAKYPGGWRAFQDRVPNQTLCSDYEIARVGFMSPEDAKQYIADLEGYGLPYRVNGEASDMVVVVDQLRGPLTACAWIEFGSIGIDGGTVAACRLKGSKTAKLFTPSGWFYQGSLSQTYGFVPNTVTAASLEYLDHREGLDVFRSRLTGEQVFVGRAGRRDEGGKK